MFAYRGEELFPSGEGGQILVFRQQHNRVWVACLGARSYLHRLLDAVVAQNRTLALSFLPHAHPVVVQIAKCQSKLFSPHLNELQRPNGFFRDIRALSVSPDIETNSAEKKTGQLQ